MQDQLAILEERGINYALWLWECSYTNYSHGVTSFNVRFGSNPANDTNMLTNEPFLQQSSSRATARFYLRQLKGGITRPRIILGSGVLNPSFLSGSVSR